MANLVPIDETVHLDVITNNPTTGAVSDADAAPTFDVYEESVDSGLLGAQTMTKRTGLTGNYRGSFVASAANGFEAGKWYVVIVSATVAGIAGKVVAMHFRAAPAEIVAGVPKVDLGAISGDEAAADSFETMLDGTGGQTLSLGQLSVINAAGDAIVARSTGGNGRGINAEGNGSGAGIRSVGGATGAGVRIDGGTNGTAGQPGLAVFGGVGSSEDGMGAVITQGGEIYINGPHGVLIVGGGDDLKTDNVASIANQTTILNRLGAFAASGANTVLGLLQAIMRKDVATPSDVGGTYSPATDALEALKDDGLPASNSSAIATAVLAAGDVDGFTLEQTLKLCLSALAGKLSGAATTTITIRAADDSKARITATVDADGNRTAITLDAAG